MACIDRLGQYMEIESTSVPWNGAVGGSDIRMMNGLWKVLCCPAKCTVGDSSTCYGLNTRFRCDNSDLTTGLSTYPSRSLSKIGNTSTAAVVSDTAGESRWSGFWFNPVMVFGNGNVDQSPMWSGAAVLQPFLVMPRHRGGCNLGFLDGHVRSSPSIVIEDQAKTVLPSRITQAP